MKRFVFTLQSVYDVAVSTEKEQKIILMELNARLARLHEQLEHMQTDLRVSKAKCAKEMSEGISSEKLAQYSFYFDKLITAIELQKDIIQKTQAERDHWMQEQIKVRNKLKTLDKIRDKQYQQYLQAVRKEEDAQIGDMISYRIAKDKIS